MCFDGRSWPQKTLVEKIGFFQDINAFFKTCSKHWKKNLTSTKKRGERSRAGESSIEETLKSFRRFCRWKKDHPALLLSQHQAGNWFFNFVWYSPTEKRWSMKPEASRPNELSLIEFSDRNLISCVISFRWHSFISLLRRFDMKYSRTLFELILIWTLFL